MRVIFHINDISKRFIEDFLCNFMKNLTKRVPIYTQIYFYYSTVTSAFQGSLLACTRTFTIFRMLTYM